ncbi:L-threonine aldolase [Murinocardiopsis flavida]|uniref:L-threonine aldolase n=1 Tax=Murinocardiopsis flavida TaxID=645275 RepID=A0A2P8D224_9ACTN|nr:GntG family PLP-dependent aldolase [Murinocardiopsis flavida]PSK91275.1 L-threonine aldolase [Murinocardiopsis flavida]
MIDLRSDTVTRPGPAMRQAMAQAEVGDDVFGEDPTIRELEEETAARLGKEAALYVPSGTMSNQLAVLASLNSGEEFWAHSGSHLITDEQGGTSLIARALPRTFDDPGGAPSDEVLAAWTFETGDIHRARPRLICLENTMTGRPVALREQRRVGAFARRHSMRAHLDGARLWNAAVALDARPEQVAEPFDTVSVCFSKSLGAPVGSALAGDADAIDRARRGRKLLGAGMRQAGIIAAGALYALRNHVDRLAEDHARASRLALGLRERCGFHAEAHTNMVVLTTPPGEAERHVAAFAAHGVRCLALDADRIRLVLHLEVDDSAVGAAVDAIAAATR